jgi:hypothetical protein
VVLHVIVLGVTSRISHHVFLQIENIEVLGLGMLGPKFVGKL